MTKTDREKIRKGLTNCCLGGPDEIEKCLTEKRDACGTTNEWFRAENRLHIHRLESIVEEQKLIMLRLLDNADAQDRHTW